MITILLDRDDRVADAEAKTLYAVFPPADRGSRTINNREQNVFCVFQDEVERDVPELYQGLGPKETLHQLSLLLGRPVKLSKVR